MLASSARTFAARAGKPSANRTHSAWNSASLSPPEWTGPRLPPSIASAVATAAAK